MRQVVVGREADPLVAHVGRAPASIRPDSHAHHRRTLLVGDGPVSRVRCGPVPIHAPTPSGTANRYVRHFPARILIKDQEARILPDLSASAIV